jgi:hypothetical protein
MNANECSLVTLEAEERYHYPLPAIPAAESIIFPGAHPGKLRGEGIDTV